LREAIDTVRTLDKLHNQFVDSDESNRALDYAHKAKSALTEFAKRVGSFRPEVFAKASSIAIAYIWRSPADKLSLGISLPKSLSKVTEKLAKHTLHHWMSIFHIKSCLIIMVPMVLVM
jgi:hypothetical protein